jgi:hypothetical protein
MLIADAGRDLAASAPHGAAYSYSPRRPILARRIRFLQSRGAAGALRCGIFRLLTDAREAAFTTRTRYSQNGYSQSPKGAERILSDALVMPSNLVTYSDSLARYWKYWWVQGDSNPRSAD